MRNRKLLVRLGARLFPALLLVCLGAVAAHSIQLNLPIAVRITAYVNQKPEGIKPDYDWLVAERGTEYRLYVLNLLVKEGGALPGDIEQAVEPYRVKFDLAGEKTALQKLKSLPPGRQVVINAYLQFGEGARYMMLDTVDVGVEPTVPATPAKAG